MHGDMLCKGMIIHSSGHSFNKQAWIQKIKVIKMYRDPINLVYVITKTITDYNVWFTQTTKLK